MKQYFLTACIGIVLLSCSTEKEEVDPTLPLLTGNWNWIESSGGIDGRTETPETTGNSITLEISADSINTYINGELQSTQGYAIETHESILFGEPREMIVYEDQFRQTILITGNRLVLYDECTDCFQHEYERE